MRMVTAIALYKKSTKQLFNLSVVTTNGITSLIRYNPNEPIEPYKYNDLNDMYRDILSIIKQNNYYVRQFKDFRANWFNIQWIDIENPIEVKIYPYFKKEG